jgi:hypothetical protein
LGQAATAPDGIRQVVVRALTIPVRGLAHAA